MESAVDVFFVVLLSCAVRCAPVERDKDQARDILSILGGAAGRHHLRRLSQVERWSYYIVGWMLSRDLWNASRTRNVGGQVRHCHCHDLRLSGTAPVNRLHQTNPWPL